MAASVVCAVAASLAGGCGSATSNVAPSPIARCGVSITPSAGAFDAAGGAGRLTVAAARECAWSATASVPWITVTSAANGQGNATVDFTVAKNTDPSARTGSISVSDQTVSIQQKGADCSFQLSSTDATVPASGGARDIDVHASNQACRWTAQSQSDWIAIRAGASGQGDGRVTFEASATAGPPRTGALVVAGRTITVVQANGCAYQVTPSSVSAAAAGADASLSITAAAGCPWSATSNANWLSVAAPNTGTGAGAVHVSIARNTGPERSGTVGIAGTNVTVRQDSGCSYAISPGSASFGAAGGSAQATVTVEAGCPWTATTRDSWLAVTGGSSSSGAGTFTISASSNSGPARTGSVNVANQTIAVSQASGCTFTVTPNALTYLSSGGAVPVSLAASDAACGWTASGAPPWITAAPASGAGAGQIVVTAAPNAGPERTGSLSVGGQSIALDQFGGCSYDLSASSASFDASGGNGGFEVTTVDGCRWKTTIQGGDGWVTLTRGDSGNGSGPVQFTVAPNTGPARTATLVIENRPFTIFQAGAQ